MTPSEVMTSHKGFFVATNETKTGAFIGFVPITATVVTNIRINNSASDIALATWGIAGISFPIGFPVLFADDENITSITITGSAYLIRR